MRHRVIAWVHNANAPNGAFMIGQVCDQIAHIGSAEKNDKGDPTEFALGHWPTPRTDEWDQACYPLAWYSKGWTRRTMVDLKGSAYEELPRIAVKLDGSIRADDEPALAKALGVQSLVARPSEALALARERYASIDRALEEIPLLLGPVHAPPGKSPLANRIKVLEELLHWSKLCPEVCFMHGIPDREDLEKELGRLRSEQSPLCRDARQKIDIVLRRYELIEAAQGEAKVQTSKLIDCLDQLIAWWDKCPDVCRGLAMPPKSQLQKRRTELKQWLHSLGLREIGQNAG